MQPDWLIHTRMARMSFASVRYGFAYGYRGGKLRATKGSSKLLSRPRASVAFRQPRLTYFEASRRLCHKAASNRASLRQSIQVRVAPLGVPIPKHLPPVLPLIGNASRRQAQQFGKRRMRPAAAARHARDQAGHRGGTTSNLLHHTVLRLYGSYLRIWI